MNNRIREKIKQKKKNENMKQQYTTKKKTMKRIQIKTLKQ